MKRSLLACGLCTAMLATAVFVFMPAGLAKGLFPTPGPQKENVLEALLDLPAPPPPNPLETKRSHDDSFYDPKNPPPDNAPIEDLIDYWQRIAHADYRGGAYFAPKPSSTVAERLLAAEENRPAVVLDVLSILPDDSRTVELVKSLYDGGGTPASKKGLRQWLTMNSAYFAEDLERVSSKTHDVGGYVSLENEDHVLALTKYDWDRARPIVDQMYSDTSQPVTRVLATWALYKHALETGDIGDVERYRSELMKTVENRSLPPGIRDKANDALTHEADFPGRDDWAFGLWEDETWVKLPNYTGLTTLVMESPPDKYLAKLTELSTSKNKLVRTAAVRCLVTVLERKQDEEMARVLLPWISDPNWVDVDQSDQSRVRVVSILQSVKMPESVPALITALDEKATHQVEDYGSFANSSNSSNTNRMSVGAFNTASRMANMASNANFAPRMKEETYFPLREYAVRALAFQRDPRAVPALKRILATMTGYQRMELMTAIMACGGYTVPEQVDALENYTRKAAEMMAVIQADGANSASSNSYIVRYYDGIRNITEGDNAEEMLGMIVASTREPSDELARATIARIDKLEPKEPVTAKTLRQIIINWKGLAVSALLLHDLGSGKAESAAIVRLLAERKLLREKLSPDVADLHNGTPIAAGISACLSEDANSYPALLDSKSIETRTALLACARLVRAELPLTKVAENTKSADPILKSAAELYLESEDSPEARSIVFAEHAGEAKILGAAVYFKGRKDTPRMGGDLSALFESVNPNANWAPYMYSVESYGDAVKTEERLQKEVKDEPDIMGVYAYDNNFVRIYKDRVVFSWEDDPSRFHERSLSAEEFSRLKQHLADHRVNELKPFLACTGGCGTAKELLMIGKNGGSRVFVRADRMPVFFAGLEKILADFRAEPSAIKYALGKEVPGLELLFASDELEAQTVWKQGSDLRIVVSNKAVREKVEEEIGELEEAERDDEGDSDEEPVVDTAKPEPTPEMLSPADRMRIKREYEGFAWHHVENGGLSDMVAQPAGIEYIPLRDQLDIQPDDETWKARAAGIEIRTDSTGLYKVAGGRSIRLKTGDYRSAVITPNGRWVVVAHADEDEAEILVRYNLITNREYKVTFDGDGSLRARCYIPAIGKFLVAAGYYYEDYEEADSSEENSPMRRFYLLDPETGALAPVNGDARPLSVQTFRPLQPTTKPNEFWAALPSGGKENTVVGTFDSRSFRFTPVLKLPKISFTSMDMWVDEAESKVYFVYNGHLLRIPLKSTPTK